MRFSILSLCLALTGCAGELPRPDAVRPAVPAEAVSFFGQPLVPAVLPAEVMYKGELSPEDLQAGASGDLDPPTFGYGLGNWHLYNGRREEAIRLFRDVLARGNWPAFGATAAEADLKRLEERPR